MTKVRFSSMLVILATVGLAPAAMGQFSFSKLTGDQGSSSKTIAYFKLAGPLTETPVAMPPLFGTEPPASLKSVLSRFREARLDDNVVAVVVDLEGAQLGFAQLEEIHTALKAFKAVDKDVYVHANTLQTGTYALATAASHINIVPTGDLWLLGLYGETPYLRGALDKLGLAADMEHCGDFKTGPEPLLRTGPSEQSKEMSKWLLDRLFSSLVDLIAESRGMTSERVLALIDGGPYSATDAKDAGLIDSVQHRQDFITNLKNRYGKSVKIVSGYGKDDEFSIPEDPFAFFSFLAKMMNPMPTVHTEPSVAVIYVEGMIQMGQAEISPFGSTGGAFSRTIRKALDTAARDDSVKAVLLRVDSPGGSALASEIIWNAAERVAAKKPLIVSMGNVAASGGYYVSCGADTIFADDMTITASIGVFGGKIVTTSAWNKLGINWHGTQRGEMAAMMSSAAPFSDAERTKLVGYMNHIYGEFKQRIVDGRGKRLIKPIDEIAGGRVYTGAHALELGLVDKLGGFDDAIHFAAQRAGLDDYELRIIPEPATIFDLFMPKSGDDEVTGIFAQTKASLIDLPGLRTLLGSLAAVDPQRAQAMMRMIQRVELIHTENAVMVTPAEFLIR